MAHFGAQPLIRALKQDPALEERFGWDPVPWFGEDRAALVERAEAAVLPTFALLTLDGRWLDGSSHPANVRFNAYIDGLPDSALLVRVMYHSSAAGRFPDDRGAGQRASAQDGPQDGGVGLVGGGLTARCRDERWSHRDSSVRESVVRWHGGPGNRGPTDAGDSSTTCSPDARKPEGTGRRSGVKAQ
ncbi:hypothetical protein ACFY8P_21300 [Streptomyces sp. NPDC012693]|uniref:hypothetical protein n=1 Tax=Streptomyces sp. NPDC012693 TaxID=3364844 RepID=UPI00369CE5BD